MNIADFENKYSGCIFLIGSGPSIKGTPIELLQDEYTFAANSIPDIFSETDWRPSFYACVDDGVDTRYCEEAIDLYRIPVNSLVRHEKWMKHKTKSIPVVFLCGILALANFNIGDILPQ